MTTASIAVYTININYEKSLFCVVGSPSTTDDMVPVLMCQQYFQDDYDLYDYDDNDEFFYQEDTAAADSIEVTTNIKFLPKKMLDTATKIGECPLREALSNCIMGVGIYRAFMRQNNREPSAVIILAEEWAAASMAKIAESMHCNEAWTYVKMCITKGLKTHGAYEVLAAVFCKKHMACVIQRSFRHAIADPNYAICKSRLQREFETIREEIA